MRVRHGQPTAARPAKGLAAAIVSAALLSAAVWFAFARPETSADPAPPTPQAAIPGPEVSAPAKTAPNVPRPTPADTQVAVPGPTINPATPPVAAPTPTPPAASPQVVVGAPRVGDERVVLRTVAGDMVLALYPDVAPETVKQILKFARLGVFDTMHFGAMQPGFYLQLYNPEERLLPLAEGLDKQMTPIPGELSSLHHRRGTLSMPPGVAGEPDSAVCSFSIMLGDAAHVDGKQAVFGHVESGMEVLDSLEKVPLWGGTPRPAVRLTILQAEVVPAKDLPGLVLEKARPVADVLDDGPYPALAVRARALLKDRCFRCHGGDKPAGGLDLTSQAAAFRGGKHGPAVYRGNALSSLLRKRVTASDQSVMPREGPPLSVAEVALLTAWIDAGADYPPGTGPTAPAVGEGEVSAVSAEDAAFWSFAPLQKVMPPAVKDPSRARSTPDRFLLAALEAKGLSFNEPADRRTLIRRLSFDLLGLPPTPQEVDAFVADPSPDAYERLVDRLLGSPHFGEHLARDWLDLARYADSGGYEDDNDRPLAYTYRDFVIRAFNDDLPFNTFLQWQVAGDELEPDNRLALAATGFATAGPLQSFRPAKSDRYDELDDIVTTVGTAMLGLTVGCARCHDHKSDPIPQRDYYRMQAVFAGSRREERPLAPDDGTELRKQIDYFTKAVGRLEGSLRSAALKLKINALTIPDGDKALLRQPVDPANSKQAALLRQYGPALVISDADMFPDPDDRVSLLRLTSQLDELKEKNLPKGLTLAGSGYGRVYFLDRGDPAREREGVYPGFLTVLTPGRPVWKKHTWEALAPRTPDRPVPQPRRALARWLTDVDGGAGRLAARVIVNRLWQHHFGEGLVRTPNDFGAQGDHPSNPELLDWLAGELIARDWHLKPIHRLIVTSAAYCQSAAPDSKKTKADPENRLVGRFRPRRLSAESLRDALLVVSGSLNREMYGPAIKPPMPPEAIFPTAPKHGVVWPADAEDGPSTWRRSVYIAAKRSNPVPFLQTFDGPDASASCARRGTTTVPTQALILMNDPFVAGQSRRFAERVRSAAGDSPAAQVREAFRIAFGRLPDSEEAEKAVRFLHDHPLADFCQVLVQANEFAYVD